MSYEPEKVFDKDTWDAICQKDPTFMQFRSASQWQGGYDVAKVYFADNPLAEVLGEVSKDGKGKSPNWRDLQKKCWELYRTFGPISAAVNSKADYTAGHGFNVYSPDLEIRLWLKDVFYSYRNKLYATLTGWAIRMLAEGELFVLLAFDDEGKVTVRVLEPERIGKGSKNDGLLTNPDDVTQTLFYEHFYTKQDSELIPDISIAFNPDVLKDVKIKDIEGYDEKKTERSKGQGNKFGKVGGYRRFVLHWKNLTGIHEYKRDLSVISTVLEAIHLYWNAIKWQLDHKKAQCAYTNVVGFEDSPQGRIAYSLWKSLSEAERKATGLTGALTPGSTVFLLPGMNFEVKAPQLAKLEGENQDLLNVAGSGVRSPQDLFQGQSSGSTYASLRASRSPLEVEIKNTQYKLSNFLRYEFLRAVFLVAARLGKFPEIFQKEDIQEFKKGEPQFVPVDVEPVELVELTFPEISFEEKLEGKAGAYLGSKHAGMRSLGISDKRIAEKMGISDLARQRAERALEERTYGKKEAILNEKGSEKTSAKDSKDSKNEKEKNDDTSKEEQV